MQILDYIKTIYVLLLVCYWNKPQNTRRNDKDILDSLQFDTDGKFLFFFVY